MSPSGLAPSQAGVSTHGPDRPANASYSAAKDPYPLIGSRSDIGFMTAPSTLYHYTSFSALQGIVASRTVWATSVHYLNDAREYRHALGIARDTLWEMRSSDVRDDLERAVFARLEEYLNSESQIRVCVFSLSEHSNQLSQWRAYCPKGRGVSIGFEAQELLSVVRPLGFKLIQCIYNEDQQRQLVTKALSDGLQQLRQVRKTQATDEKALLRGMWEYYSRALADLSPHLKHPAFVEEAEWRLVSDLVPMDHPQLRVRPTDAMLIPYFELPIDLGNRRLPITNVVVGPTDHVALASTAIMDLFSVNKTTFGGSVIPSHVPLRTFA